METCSIQACDRPLHARGWCHTHYVRWRRRGDPEAKRLDAWRGRRQSLSARFWPKVRKGPGCWEWQAFVHHTGYGYMASEGRTAVAAHRVSWLINRGPIPDGLFVMHMCDNRICVRPAHLRLGTAAANAKDRDSKGRNINHRGALNGQAKITQAQADEIRQLRAGGAKVLELCSRFGLSKTSVKHILHNRSWVA